jgi:hypothetical protein
MTVSLSKILDPVTILAKILGGAPFKIAQNRVQYSVPYLIQTVLFQAINLILNYLYLRNFDKVTYSSFGSAKLMRFILLFRLLAFTAIMFVSLFFTRDLAMSVKKTMQKIVDIDVSLTKLVQKQYLERRNHRVRRYGIKLLLTINLVFNTLGSVYNAYCKKSDQYLYFFITWYPRVVVSTKLIGYLTVITTIRTRLEVINNLLLLEVVESNKLKKFPVKHDFGEYVDGLVTLHKDLIRTSQELADSFSPFLLVWISTHFVILLGDSYAGFNVILNDNPVKHLNVVIGLVKNCIGYAVDLYALSVKSSDLCREVSHLRLNSPSPV